MNVRCIHFTGELATIVFEPGWVGLVLGARTVSLDLEYVVREARDRVTGVPETRDWRTIATRRWIEELAEVDAIRNALDFREIGTPSRFPIVEDEDEAMAP